MSRISNLSNLRIPHFNSWKTLWYENDKNYSFLFFRDFQLFQYLKGIFYKLKMITDDFYFDNITSNCFFLKVNIYLYKFQIKKYFLTLFMDQYLVYNFLLKKRFFLYHLPTFFSVLFFTCSISFSSVFSKFINNNIIFFFYSTVCVTNKISHRYRKYIYSLGQLNNKRKYLIHPLKLKLKKNFIFFFNILKKKNNFSSQLISKYYFYIVLKNILFFLSNMKFNYFFYKFYFFLNSKLLLLESIFFFIFNTNSKSRNHNSFYYLKENYKRELGRDIFDDRTYYDFFFIFFYIH